MGRRGRKKETSWRTKKKRRRKEAVRRSSVAGGQAKTRGASVWLSSVVTKLLFVLDNDKHSLCYVISRVASVSLEL